MYQEGEKGFIKLLGQPDSGEYAGQTRFLDPEANDGEDIMRRISFAYLDSMTALFLLTDGITDPIFETDYNLQQPACWDKFWVEDIRQKLSSTPGETEKNLSKVFDAAENGGVILFFDEADALFGKRSEVKDSHDRYANVEISYLLQRMESYRGLAILATNMKKSDLDQAFIRRLRFIVNFPFPD